MTRFLTTALALALPLVAAAQGTGDLGAGPPAPAEAPRTASLLDNVTGYADLMPDFYGTPDAPKPNDLGMLMVMRIFQNVCLGLERGVPLEQAMPPGFTGYHRSNYMFGDGSRDPVGAAVLSATGDIDADETNGHPTVWIAPNKGSVTCRAEWRVPGDIPDDTQQAMAIVLEDWFPFIFALVRVSRPLMTGAPTVNDAVDWDRPCGDLWCPVRTIFQGDRGYFSVETRLNIDLTAGTGK